MHLPLLLALCVTALAPADVDAPSIPGAPVTRSAARTAARELLERLRGLPEGRRVAATPDVLAQRLAELAAFLDAPPLDPAEALIGGPDAAALARLRAAGLALDDPAAGARAALELPARASAVLALAAWHLEAGDEPAYRATLAALDEHLADAADARTTLTRLLTLQTRLDRVDDALATVERLGRENVSRRTLDALARALGRAGRWDEAHALTSVVPSQLVGARLQALHDAGLAQPMLSTYLEGRELGVDADAWTEIAVFALTALDREQAFDRLRPSDDPTAVTLDAQRWESLEKGALPAGRAVRAARAGALDVAREFAAGLDPRRHWAARAAVEICAAAARAGDAELARALAEGARFAVPPAGRLMAPTAELVPLRERVARETARAQLERGDVAGALDTFSVWGRPAGASPGESAAWLARSLAEVLDELPPDAAAHGRAFVVALLDASAGARPWEHAELSRALATELGSGRFTWLAETWSARELERARAALAASTRAPNYAREGFPESRDRDTLAVLREVGGLLARAGLPSAWTTLRAELPDDECRALFLLGTLEQLLVSDTASPADATPSSLAAAMLVRDLR